MPSSTTPDILKARLQLARNAQNDKWSLFTDLDEIFHVQGKPQEADAQMHAPDSWSNVETVAPRMVARRPTITFKPLDDPFNAQRSDEEKRQFSDRLASIWEHWWDKDGAFTKNVAWVKGSLRHGTKMARTYWKTVEEEVTDYVYDPEGLPVVGEDGKFVEQTRTETTFDDATMELISSYDFGIDPETIAVQPSAWVIFKYRQTLDELKAYGRFTNLKSLEGKLNESESLGGGQQERSRAISGLGSLEDDSTIDRVTCYEMWERGSKGIRKCTVAGGIEIEKWKPNPFRHRKYPFIRLLDSIVDGEFWGKGEIEPVRYFQYALDTYHSLDVTNRNQAMERKWKVDGNVDEWELANSPYVHVNKRNGTDVEPFEIPDYTATSGPAIDLTRNTMSNALGIYDYAKGGETGPNDTATGITAVQEAANARFNLKIQMYEEALKELAFQVISLYQQHKTDWFQIEVDDGNGGKTTVSVAPAEIAGSFVPQVESGSSRPANREAERQDALQVYQLTQPIQAQDPQFAMEALKFVLDRFDGTNELEEALEASFGRVQQAQQQQQQVQAQQQQVIAGQQQDAAGAADHQAALTQFQRRQQALDQREKALLGAAGSQNPPLSPTPSLAL